MNLLPHKYKRKQRPLNEQEGVFSMRRQSDFQTVRNLNLSENFDII